MITTDQKHNHSGEKRASLAGLVASAEAGRAGEHASRDLQLAALRGFAGDLPAEIAAYETRGTWS